MSPNQQASSKKYRNTAFVIDQAAAHFDMAYRLKVMGIWGKSLHNRQVELQTPGDLPDTLVDFVRCSYLGLDNHPKVIEGALAAIDDYRSVHWSCARTRLNFGLLRDLEAKLSDLFRCRAAIAFSSVMLANLGALPLIASGHLTDGVKPVVVFDRFCHASLAYHKPVIANETEVVTIGHNDMAALEAVCKRSPCVAYVADGVYSMGGSAPIPALRRLQEEYGLFLYIDDAHGISILGSRGEGFARSQLPADLGPRCIVAASLGKGFGASGGVLLLGTEQQEDIFRRFAQPYAFSAAPNLAAVGAALGSAEVHATAELGRLQAALGQRIRAFDEQTCTPQRGSPLPICTLPIGKQEDAERILDACIERLGGVDILVNNAGTNPYAGRTIDVDLARWDKTVQVNLTAPLVWTQLAWRHWMQEHGGTVLNISSVGALKTSGALGVYGVTKAALLHLTEQLAAELGPGVRVNAICPGLVRTDFAQALWDGDRGTDVAKAYPLERLGDPEDIAGGALFLAADTGSWITGQTLVLDGGGLIAIQDPPLAR